MHPTITLARIAGIRIGVNWSWLIVFALIVWTLESTVFPSTYPDLTTTTYVAMAAVAAVLFFCSRICRGICTCSRDRLDQV